MEGIFSAPQISPGSYTALLFLSSAVLAYFLGCFNGAVIVSRFILRDDVREHGSGNAGLTNFYRTFGGWLTFVVILCDVLKAVLSVLIGAALLGQINNWALLGKYWAGLFCMLGHVFPCLFHFKGGKGVLSGGAIAVMIDWRVALVVWSIFFILAVLTKYVSLGSVAAGALFPVATWFVFHSPVLTLLAVGCGGLLIWGHRENIKRLLHGTERKFSFRHQKTGEGRP